MKPGVIHPKKLLTYRIATAIYTHHPASAQHHSDAYSLLVAICNYIVYDVFCIYVLFDVFRKYIIYDVSIHI